MRPPQVRADRLWSRLAEAQDAALRQGPPPIPRATVVRRPRARRIGAALLLVGGGAIAALVMLAQRTPAPPRVGPGGRWDEAGNTLVADARSDLPLQFSNGSRLLFRAGSTGRMQRLSEDGAQVFLEHGQVQAHVVHTPSTLWMLQAGPYRIRVTGTRFAVSWVAARLEVSLFEGSVVIDGAELGAGVPLRAGQRLTVDRGVVRTELLGPPGLGEAAAEPPAPEAREAHHDEARDETAAPVTTAAASSSVPAEPAVVGAEARGEVTPARNRASDDNEWLVLAKQSAYAEAFTAAMRVGWKGLCHRLDAHRLLTLGDVARYAGSRARAQQAFEALVTRFPRDPLAADAVFSLGRLAFESDQSDSAARWFRRYVDDWPQGPLADQAVGRLVECAIHMHDSDAARGAARAYLARAPSGPHARLARQILRDGAGPTAIASPDVAPSGSR